MFPVCSPRLKQQLRGTSIADPDPDDGRAAVRQLVHSEVLVLGHNDCARFRSPRTNLRVRGSLQTEIGYVFSYVASRFQLARECRRELGVDEKAQSRAPQDGVVVLPGGKLQHCGGRRGSTHRRPSQRRGSLSQCRYRSRRGLHRRVRCRVCSASCIQPVRFIWF
jgi:hypothetical protein